MVILAFIPPVVIGTAIVVLIFPNCRLKGAWGIFTVCLGAGIGLGITSSTTFLWLAGIGRPGAAYLVFESGGAIVLAMIAYSRFHVYQSAGRSEWTPDAAANDLPIKWLQRLVVVLLFITAGSFGLKTFFESPYGTVDTRIVWNYRARWIFRGGDHWKHAFYTPVAPEGELIDDQGHAPDYPLLITGSVYRGWEIIGSDPAAVPILIAGLFTFGTYLLLYAALALLRNRNQGCLAVLFMLITTQFMHLGTDQYGDVPLAFFIMSTIALFALKDRFPAISLQTMGLIGFTAACAAWTKNEGLVFFAAVILVRFIGRLGKQDGSDLAREFFCFLLGALPVMGTLVYFKLNFAPRNDLVNIYNLKHSVVHLLNPERYLIVISEILKKVYFFNDKIVILLIVYWLLSGADRSGKGRKRIGSHVLLLLLMLCGYTFAYVITTYDLRWHIDSSLRRLFIQLWPAWVLLFFYGVRGPEAAAEKDRGGVFKYF